MLSQAHPHTELVPSAPARAPTGQANNQERSVVVQSIRYSLIRRGHDTPGGPLSAGGADQVGAVVASCRPPARGVLVLPRETECGAYREKSGRTRRGRRAFQVSKFVDDVGLGASCVAAVTHSGAIDAVFDTSMGSHAVELGSNSANVIT